MMDTKTVNLGGDSSISVQSDSPLSAGAIVGSTLLSTLGWLTILYAVINMPKGNEVVNNVRNGKFFGVGLGILSASYLLNPYQFKSGVTLRFDE